MINIQNLSHQGSILNFFLLQNDMQTFTTKQLSKFHINKDLEEINVISLQCLFGCHIKVQVLLLTNFYNCVTFASFKRNKSRRGVGTEKRHLLFHHMALTKVKIICFKRDAYWKIMCLSILPKIWTLLPFIRTKCTVRAPQVPFHLLCVPLFTK